MAGAEAPPLPSIPRAGFLAAAATTAYVALVATGLFYAGEMRRGQPPTPLVPIAMLMLLVFSAAFVGALIFLRPALWYLDGRKAEALVLLAYTLGFLFVLAALAMVAMMTLAPMHG